MDKMGGNNDTVNRQVELQAERQRKRITHQLKEEIN